MRAAGALFLGWQQERSRRVRTRRRFVAVLPVPLAAAHLVENGIIATAVGAFPDRAPLAGALPLVTTVEFGGAPATFVACVALGLVWIGARAADPGG